MSVYGPVRKKIITGKQSPDVVMLKFTGDTGTPHAGELSPLPVHGEVDGVKLSCPIQVPILILICISGKGLARQII